MYIRTRTCTHKIHTHTHTSACTHTHTHTMTEYPNGSWATPEADGPGGGGPGGGAEGRGYPPAPPWGGNPTYAKQRVRVQPPPYTDMSSAAASHLGKEGGSHVTQVGEGTLAGGAGGTQVGEAVQRLAGEAAAGMQQVAASDREEGVCALQTQLSSGFNRIWIDVHCGRLVRTAHGVRCRSVWQASWWSWGELQCVGQGTELIPDRHTGLGLGGNKYIYR